MIFNASATHALRAAQHLAGRSPAEVVLGRDLAARIDVPAHYLAKVLATLARAGLLAASRGARGGYRLARRPSEITLLQLVEPFEGRRIRPGCLLRPDSPCSDDGACGAHRTWAGVKETWLRFLETTTLADLAGPARPLAPVTPPRRSRRRSRGAPAPRAAPAHRPA